MKKTHETLAQAIDHDALRRMAGARSFARGCDYFANGHVNSIVQHQSAVSADVQGSHAYRVRLWIEGKQLEYSCTCPVGADGAFCKHAVAVGLACLAEQEPVAVDLKTRRQRTVSKEDVRADLAAKSNDELVALLMEAAEENEPLGRRLRLHAAGKRGRRTNLATFREAIDDAVIPDGFVSYREMSDYARGIEDAVDSVAELLKAGHAVATIELAEYALIAVEKAMGSLDDSDGYMSGILDRLQEIHHAACVKAKPDRDDLAARLFEWELRTEWDTFIGAAQTYADVLGKEGLRVYQTLAEDTWSRIPALGPGDKDPIGYSRRFRIAHILETLARQSGDLEALIAVKERDLSCAYSFLQIAEACRQARQRDLALDWAERGARAFPERTDSRLREFLAEEYHHRKRHNDAMALMWAEFTDSASLDRYQKLKDNADRISQWPAWRAKALAHLRSQTAKAMAEKSKSRWGPAIRSDHSALVTILLWEKDVESAWSEAKVGGCSNNLWLQLALLLEKNHPDAVVPIYQQQIEPTLARKNNEAYREAVGSLRKICKLMRRLGKEAEFEKYLESVHTVHKPKRNFIKLLEHAKWE